MRLHLGCGHRLLEGWTNVDMDAHPGVFQHDLRRPLPFSESSVDEVYSEHFLEHIEYEDALKLLINCNKVLKPSGKIRISTPDLAELVLCYTTKHLDRFQNVGWVPPSPCKMMNQGMRWWGHLYLYDEQELTEILQAAGFKNIKRVPVSPLYECRPNNNDLVVEAFL